MRNKIWITVLALSAAPALALDLVNPGFEEASGDDAQTRDIRGWFRFGTNVHSLARNVHEGVRCVRVRGENNGEENYCGVYQEFPVVPGQRVRVGMMTMHASDEPLLGDGHALVKIEYFDAQSNFLGVATSGDRLAKGSVRDHYRELHAQAEVPTNGAMGRIVGILIQTISNETGAVYFDSATVEMGP